MQRELRLATRGSPLALRQVEIVRDLLASASREPLDVVAVVVESSGDRRKDVPIHAIGGQGVFVAEVDEAVHDGRADAAVHSAKDVPSSAAYGLDICAVPPRADRRDALVGRALADLTPGALVATGSVRRRAQLAWLRPDLTFAELRGNLGTRLDKVPDGGAVVVAAAALERLGLSERAAQLLSVAEMLPQVGQGALAVCCRRDDEVTRRLVSEVDDPGSHRSLLCERAFLASIGGACDLPVGASAAVSPAGDLSVQGLVCSEDGHRLVRAEATASPGEDAEELGRTLAAEILDSRGGRGLLTPLRPEASRR